MATVLGFHLQHIQELISFRMDWLYLLADQGTLKSLLQHHSSKASVFLRSAFFTVQLSHPYVTTGKTIALTTQTFVGKIMSLLFNMLSSILKVGYNFSSKEQTSFNLMAAATICSGFRAQENKDCHGLYCFLIYFPWSDGTGCHDLHFLNVEFQANFSLSSFTFIKRLFSSLLSAIRVVSSAYLRLLMFLLAILIPACASSSPAFLHTFTL